MGTRPRGGLERLKEGAKPVSQPPAAGTRPLYAGPACVLENYGKGRFLEYIFIERLWRNLNIRGPYLPNAWETGSGLKRRHPEGYPHIPSSN